MLIREDLHLDVARGVDEMLEEQRVVAERGGGLAAGPLQRGRQLRRLGHAMHPLATATRTGLDENREPDVGCRGDEVVVGQAGARQTRHHRHVASGDGGPGRDLVSHRRDRLRGRPDEDDARLRQSGREFLVLREESVARVDGVGTGLACRVDHFCDVEVALGGGGRADVHGDVGLPDVARLRVGVGIDGDTADSHVAQGVYHPAGDLTTVGHQDAADGSGTHGRGPRARRDGAVEIGFGLGDVGIGGHIRKTP